MDKRIQFCGTPLSKSLSDKNNDDGPVTARRVRLNRQQIVKDAQGRQRFHGAFTGGFSAGYYNTVDTVEGFKPRQFITHRGHNRSAGASSFSHKPEDYMDDEDFGEFGIAPRKIRVATSYSSIDSSQNDQPTFGSTPQAKILSIGQRMLQHMEGGLDWLRELKMYGGQSIDVAKKDFHGLGYKALESRFSSQPSSLLSKNPLSAMLDKEGKRIKISGEAFGTGVLEDDEDYLNSSDLYGYDDMSNYDFQPKSRAQQSTSKTSQPHKDELNLGDPGILADFKLAEDVYTIQLHDGLEDGYKLPDIPVDWRMPSREVPYIPPVDETAASQKLKLIGHQSSSAFNKKFISASEKRLESSEIGTKAGLLHYSDLKATVAPREQDPIVPDAVKATITRVQFEWRPCSLLCKHFNVPNPYPGDPFVGTKTPDQARPLDDQMGLVAPAEKPVLTRQEPASLALKRSIFNVIFQDDQQPVAGRCYADTDSEDEPQIVEDKPAVIAEKADRSDDQDADDQDIVVVNALRPEPELIVLSSSSTSSSFSSPDCRRRRRRHPKASTSRESNEVEEREEELHIDTYGPPLPPKPPTPNTASDLDSHRSNARHRSSSRQRKKKSKKHKKHKRHG